LRIDRVESRALLIELGGSVDKLLVV